MDQAIFPCKQIHDIPLQPTYKRYVRSHTPTRPRMTPPRTPKAIAIGSEMRSSRALRRKRPSSHIQEHDLSSSCMMCVCVWGGAGGSVIQQPQDLYSRLKNMLWCCDTIIQYHLCGHPAAFGIALVGTFLANAILLFKSGLAHPFTSCRATCIYISHTNFKSLVQF